jgi:hypothetical protein
MPAATCRLAQRRSVLVDVIAMLKVAVAVMDVVHMLAMGHRLAAVSFGVRARVAGVHHLLGVALVAVYVIYMIVVLDRLAPVTRVVLVIDRFSVRGHLSSSSPQCARPSQLLIPVGSLMTPACAAWVEHRKVIAPGPANLPCSVSSRKA